MQKTTRTIVQPLGINAVTSFTTQIYCPFQPDSVRVRCYNASDQLVVQTTVTSTLPLETLDGVIGVIAGDIETSGVVIDNTFQCVNPINGDYTFNFLTAVDGVVVIILEFIKN
jgi:hypothetical protein